MNPRGTRRPHSTGHSRGTPKFRKGAGGGSKKGGICDIAVLAPASVLTTTPLVIALLIQ